MMIDHLPSMRRFSKIRFSIFENRYLIIEDDDEMKKEKSEIRYRKSRDISKSEMAISHACKNLASPDVVSTLLLHEATHLSSEGQRGGRWQGEKLPSVLGIGPSQERNEEKQRAKREEVFRNRKGQRQLY